MNILITGSSGFLGGATYKFLSQKHNVFPLDTKYCYDFERIRELNSDCIINFGWGGGSNSKELNSIEQFNNIKTCIDLFNFAIRCNIKKFIQISSSWKYYHIYGLNNYGFCKLHTDELLNQMAKTYNIEFIKVVPYWIYGSNDKPNRFIPSIINKCLKNEDIQLHPAQNLVDYLYVDDFVCAIDTILEKSDFNMDYQVCSGQGYKIQDIVEGIKSLTNSKSNITYNKPYPLNFKMEWIGDNWKLESLGWYPRIGISEGLQRTINCHKIK